jgi:hypothetical protein
LGSLDTVTPLDCGPLIHATDGEGRQFLLINPQSLVGVSLLAIAVDQSTFASMTHRYREQAHSYKELGSVVEVQTKTIS